jgi:Putative zinc-finger
MRCEHEHDDGAYVLGALAPAERAAYERHLATCSFCREAVRDISTLPDVLARLDARDLAELSRPNSPARRSTAMRVRVVSSVAALALVLLVAAGAVVLSRGAATPAGSPPGPAVAMTAVAAGSPLSATLRLISKAGGTRIDLTCSFSATAAKPSTLRLIAYGPDDQREQVGSWQATPGTEFPMPGVTRFGAGSLTRVEVVRYDGTALLAYDVP